MTAQTRSRFGRRLAWLAVAGMAVAALIVPTSSLAADPKVEITICHASASDSNPYIVNSPSIDSNGYDDAGGHAAPAHEGPVWFDGITVQWGDIIPPYDWAPANFHFPGYNWTAAGQAIWNNGCNAVQATATPTATPTDAPPTATPTDAPPTATPTDAPPTATPTGDVGGATGTPAGTVGGATSDPTLPTTSTIDGANGPLNDGWRVILLGLAAVLAVALLLTPATAVVRKDDASR